MIHIADYSSQQLTDLYHGTPTKRSQLHTKKRFFATVSYILAALFLVFEMCLQASPTVMMHPMMRDCHIDAATFGLIAGAYFYSYTLMQIPAGLLLDRISVRKICIFAIAVCSVGMLIFAESDNSLYLGIGRFLAGLGSSISYISLFVIAARYFSPRLFIFLVALAQCLASVGAIGGEYPLSFLVNSLGWRHSCLILAVIGITLFVLVICGMRLPHNNNNTLKSFCWHTCQRDIVRTLRNKRVRWIALYSFCAWSVMPVFASLWGVPYLMQRLHLDSSQASMITSGMWVTFAVCSLSLNWVCQRTSIYRPAFWTAAIGFVSLCVLILWPGLNPYSAAIAALGAGIGAGGQTLSIAILQREQAISDIGLALGFNNMAAVSSALLQPICGWLLRWQFKGHFEAGISHYSTHQYEMTLLVLPIIFGIACYTSYFKLRSPTARSNEPTLILETKRAM